MFISNLNTDYNKFLKNRVKEHHTEACNLTNSVFATVLQGSQNYGLALDSVPFDNSNSDFYNSDVDTKCLILPTFNDFCNSTQPISHTHIRENNEHIDLKDIRVMFETFKKQNINFLEILFSDYYIVENKWKNEWEELQSLGEAITHCHMSQTLKTMCGMSMEKKSALTHPYPTIKWKIDKWGYDGKQLHHIIRINEFMKNYIAGMSFKECLSMHSDTFLELLSNAKLNKYSLEEAKKLANTFHSSTVNLKEAFIDKYGDKITDTAPYKKLNDLKIAILRKQFKFELNEN